MATLEQAERTSDPSRDTPRPRSLTVIEAVREALRDEMERDGRVVVLGEDVGQLGGVFRATDGLLAQFGPERVIDTPMMELGIAGLAVGMAMRGLRPVAEIQFADFMHAAADHIISDAARIRFRTNGDAECPLVIRTAYGGGLEVARTTRRASRPTTPMCPACGSSRQVFPPTLRGCSRPPFATPIRCCFSSTSAPTGPFAATCRAATSRCHSIGPIRCAAASM